MRYRLGVFFIYKYVHEIYFIWWITGVPSSFEVQLRDSFGNNILSSDIPSSEVTMVGSANFVVQGFQDTIYGSASASSLGVYTINYMASWSGAYNLVVKVMDQGILNSPFNIAVDPFTCGARNSSTPFFCADDGGKCVTAQGMALCKNQPCAKYQCPTIGNITGKCVDSLSDCDCPSGYFECLDGRCVAGNNDDNCLVKNSCPNPDTPTRCLDLTCKSSVNECSNSIICSSGYILCPDYLSCQTDVSLCGISNLVVQTKCSPSSPLLCSDMRSCVNNFAECPTQLSCPTGYIYYMYHRFTF
jgi:hypothetical protein